MIIFNNILIEVLVVFFNIVLLVVFFFRIVTLFWTLLPCLDCLACV